MNGPLHLAVDAHDLARDERGIGTYTRALLSRFAQRDDVALTLLVRRWFPQRSAAALRAAIGLDARAPIRVGNRVPADAAVMWHPWNGTFFRTGIPNVATIHDVVAFARPDADAARRISQQQPIVRSAQSARAIVCDSRFTAREVQRYLAVPAQRLHPIPLGVDDIFAPGDLDALPGALRGRRYVLYVGAHDAHKNVMTLVTAHRAAFPGGDVALVFTRPNAQVPEALVFERVDRTTLVALYRGATVVAVPSIYEGFGLPVLEAMASGAPVLAARAASLPEVGGDAVQYVDDPLDPDAWRRGLRGLCANAEARAALARHGVVRAATFTWERCAAQTLDILANARLPT